MKKFNKKAINVIATAALLAGVVAPVAATVSPVAVSAATSVTALSAPTVKNDTTARELGTIKVSVPAGSLKDQNSVIVKLPSGIEFGDAFVTTPAATPTAGKNMVIVPAKNGSADNGISTTSLEVQVLDSTNEILIKAKGSQGFEDGVFFIQLGDVDVKSDASGELKVSLTSASGFPAGDVVVGTATGSAKVNVEARNTVTGNDTFTFDLHLTEVLSAALKQKADTVKVKLPSGYKWKTEGTKEVVATVGQDAKFELTKSDNELYIKLVGVDTVAEVDPAPKAYETNASTKASYWRLTDLEFEVSDVDAVKLGDIEAKVYGESSFNVDTIKVGTYGEYGLKIASAATEAKTIYAAKKDQKIDTIKVTEGLSESLLAGRTITLTLPKDVKWDLASLADVEKNGVKLEKPTEATNDGRTIKYTVRNKSTKAATLELKDLKVIAKPGFAGDVKVTVGGTAGLSGEFVAAKVVAPISLTAGTPVGVKLGLRDQAVADVVITEAFKGAFERTSGDDKLVELNLSGGVEFDGKPEVTVTEGDLKVEDVKVEGGKLTFNVKSSSDVASKISITKIKVKALRYLVEDDIKLSIKGADLVTTDNTEDKVAEIAVGRIVTPASAEVKATAVFTIDSAKYVVDGVEKTADLAPFIQDGRTFLPVRFVAEALGVSENNIIWNANTKTVTLIKGDRIAQIQLGSSNLVVNGVSVPMDTVAFVKEGRTVLPLRYAAQALGAEVTWDEATRAVTVKK